MASGSIAHSAFGLIRALGITVKDSVGDRSVRPPRLTLDPEKDALTICSECTAVEGNL